MSTYNSHGRIAIKLAVTFFAVFATSTAAVSGLANGIYSVTDVDAETGTTVTRSDDGDRVKLQMLLASEFGTPSIVSKELAPARVAILRRLLVD